MRTFLPPRGAVNTKDIGACTSIRLCLESLISYPKFVSEATCGPGMSLSVRHDPPAHSPGKEWSILRAVSSFEVSFTGRPSLQQHSEHHVFLYEADFKGSLIVSAVTTSILRASPSPHPLDRRIFGCVRRRTGATSLLQSDPLWDVSALCFPADICLLFHSLSKRNLLCD
jgi:hypothetical protein